MKPNKLLREQMKTLQRAVKKEDATEIVWIPIRGKYYRGIAVDSKAKVRQVFGKEFADKLKYKERKNVQSRAKLLHR